MTAAYGRLALLYLTSSHSSLHHSLNRRALKSLNEYASQGGTSIWIDTIAQHYPISIGRSGGSGTGDDESGGVYEDIIRLRECTVRGQPRWCSRGYVGSATLNSTRPCSRTSIDRMPDDEARIAQFMTERASPTFKISRINGTGTVWDARAEFSRVGSNFRNALTHALHAQLGANKILFVPCELRDHNTPSSSHLHCCTAPVY